MSNSGSQESNVSDRTLEQWTPKLLKGTRRKREYIKKMKCKNSLATVFYHIFALAHFTTTASGELLLYTLKTLKLSKAKLQPALSYYLLTTSCAYLDSLCLF